MKLIFITVESCGTNNFSNNIRIHGLISESREKEKKKTDQTLTLLLLT